ncbi:MAG: hypothetical protein D6726_10980 [Nitrospirae bacterium]|nr:MAG: hypothetical protein D6726_10980 [Nitrospirota bacterium]
MKKYLAIVIGMLFVLGFAASAFAIHAEIPSETQAVVAKGATQLTFGGDIRFRMDYRDNLTDQLDNSSGDEHFAQVDARVRLKIDAKVSDNTSGRIHFENDWVWGVGDHAQGTYGRGNTTAGAYKKGEGQFIEAWIQHKAGPVTVKLGHMPLALGNNLFFDHREMGDDAVVAFMNPNKQTTIIGAYAKFNEGVGGINDDANAYVLAALYNADNFGISGDATYVDDQGQNIHLWNFGIRGNVAVAGFKIKGDVELQTGEVDVAGGPDLSGWAAYVRGDYKLGNTGIYGLFAWGSGDDPDSADDVELFQNSLSAVVYDYAGYLYHYRMKTAGGGHSGIANTLIFKVGANHKVNKDLSVGASVAYLKADEDVALNGGTPDDDLGWEIDGKVKYGLDRNLSLTLEGGYFVVGDAYNHADGSSDDAWGARLVTQLSF